MLDWLVPICAFFGACALYLGGMADVHGGSGGRQVLGLVLTFILFLAGWYVLRLVTGGFFGVFGQFVIPTLLAMALMPLWSRLGFRIVGSRVGPPAPYH